MPTMNINIKKLVLSEFPTLLQEIPDCPKELSVEDILEALGIKKQDRQKTDLGKLSQIEKTIYEKLREPKMRERLIDEINVPISEVNTVLSAMEIKGIIEERLGKICRIK